MSQTQTILRQLRATRRARELSQIKVATDLGYSRWSVANAENGVHSPSFQFIIDYADYLGFDVVLIERRKRI